MAIGTITIDNALRTGSEPLKAFEMHHTGEAAYVKGTGTASFEAAVRTAAADGGLTLVGIVANMSATNPKYIPQYDAAADALKILDVSAGDEAANGNYGTTTFYYTALCV